MREPAVDREDGEQGSVQRAFNIGIFKNQHRRFTAQFHGVFFQPGVFHDVAPGGRTAGERHGTYVMMTNQRIACGCAVALYHVQHARRNTGFQRQLTQAVSGESSDIFSTAVLPSARHGATFHVAVINGTFHGDTSAQTPTGCTSV